jgi:Fe-S-cluster containining protein
LLGEILKNPEIQENYVMRLAAKTFPYKTDSSGACEKLVDGKCSVYEDRPLLCNVKELGAAMRVNETQWFKANALACNRIIDLLNLDPSYKITDF